MWSYIFYRKLTQGKTLKRWHSLTFHLSRMKGRSSKAVRALYLSSALLCNIAFMSNWETLAGLPQSTRFSGSPLDRGSRLATLTDMAVFPSKTMRRSFETHPSELQLDYGTNLQRIHSESGMECSGTCGCGLRGQ